MTKFSTHTGQVIDILTPDTASIAPLDIAVALSNAGRYAGHVAGQFTVGQHTIAIMLYLNMRHPLVPKRIRQAALIHDFPEYVLQDITEPLKQALRQETAWYDILTECWEDAICTRFNCETGSEYRDTFTKYIKPVDQMAYHAEVFVLELKSHSVPAPDDDMLTAVELAAAMDVHEVRLRLLNLIKEELA